MFQIHSSKKWMARSSALSFLVTIFGQAESSYAINFTFDYTYDTSEFFDDSTTLGQYRRTTLEAAADYFEPFTDQLSAINSYENNSWTAYFENPATGNEVSIPNLSVQANEIIVYVGARDLDSGIGLGGPGGFGISYTDTAFLNTVQARGQTGALDLPATDFGPWGGSISFDDTVIWNSETDAPTSGENDLLSVAIHEIGHLLGIGSASSWNNKISEAKFTGANSVAAYNNSNVPLYNTAHWAENTMSTVNGMSQEAAMTPNLTTGTRKLFTTLDYAALQDLGWETQNVPFEFSPGLGIILVSGLYGLSKAKAALKK